MEIWQFSKKINSVSWTCMRATGGKRDQLTLKLNKKAIRFLFFCNKTKIITGYWARYLAQNFSASLI